MPRRSLIRLDHAGIREVLSTGAVAAAVRALGESVEAAVQAHPSVQRHNMPVTGSHGVTDRSRYTVTIAHPGGLGVQAKHGALTQAAASVGLEVTVL